MRLFASKLFAIKSHSKWFCQTFVSRPRYFVSFNFISFWLGECCLIFFFFFWAKHKLGFRIHHKYFYRFLYSCIRQQESLNILFFLLQYKLSTYKCFYKLIKQSNYLINKLIYFIKIFLLTKRISQFFQLSQSFFRIRLFFIFEIFDNWAIDFENYYELINFKVRLFNILDSLLC
jgi:hypothetical protein